LNVQSWRIGGSGFLLVHADAARRPDLLGTLFIFSTVFGQRVLVVVIFGVLLGRKLALRAFVFEKAIQFDNVAFRSHAKSDSCMYRARYFPSSIKTVCFCKWRLIEICPSFSMADHGFWKNGATN